MSNSWAVFALISDRLRMNAKKADGGGDMNSQRWHWIWSISIAVTRFDSQQSLLSIARGSNPELSLSLSLPGMNPDIWAVARAMASPDVVGCRLRAHGDTTERLRVNVDNPIEFKTGFHQYNRS